MEFSDIETILVIASSKSISDAADKLFITQSTASHRLQALEMELGTSLLVRQKGVRQMELTPAGKQFTGLAEQWISLWKKTQLLKEHEKEPEDIAFSAENLAKLIELVDGGVINGNVAKEVFEQIFDRNIDPEKYVEEKGLKTVNDEGALRETIEQIVADNPKSVEDYHNGKEKAIGFLVGQTMKAMKGKADPGMVNKILKEIL